MLSPEFRVTFLALEYRAVAASVPRARRDATRFAAANHAGEEARAAIALAVDEAVTNAVRHAYPGQPGRVRIEMDVEDGELEIVVTADGVGFTTAPTEGLGMGLVLMRDSASAFEVRDRPAGGVEVWLRFRLGG